MSSPAQATLLAVRYVLLGLLLFTSGFFVLNRFVMFVDVYTDELEKYERDREIARDCEDIEFRKRMEVRYPSMCTDAKQHLRRWVALHALDTVGGATYLCGYSSCQSLLTELLSKMGLLASAIVGTLVLALGTVLYLSRRYRQPNRMLIHRMGMDGYQGYPRNRALLAGTED